MISIFELFKIGIGPSSSHTIGPMKAARRLRGRWRRRPARPTARVRVDLYGSLAWTGRGHATDKAVILGLAGTSPKPSTLIAPTNSSAAIETPPSLPLGRRRDGRLPCRARHRSRSAIDQVRRIIRTRCASWPSTRPARALPSSAGAPSAAGSSCARRCRSGRPKRRRGSLSLRQRRRIAEPAPRAGLTIAEIVFANEIALRPQADVERTFAAIIGRP